MLVTIKNAAVQLFKSSHKSDEDLARAERLLESGQRQYGSSSENDCAQLAAMEGVSTVVNKSDSNSIHEEKLKIFGTFDPRVMSDIIIGLSDGLTVPFALTAGLSSLGLSKLVITGGMAELVSGAISMGLGGYLAAKSEIDYYQNEVKKEKLQFFRNPELINQDAVDIMVELGASEQTIALFLKDLDETPKNLIDFVIRFGKGLEEPPAGREITSALTIGSGYFVGGFVPLLPYFFCDVVQTGLLISVVVMIITLFIFGYVKTSVSLGEDSGTKRKVWEGLQMVVIGSVAAGAAWTLVYLIE